MNTFYDLVKKSLGFNASARWRRQESFKIKRIATTNFSLGKIVPYDVFDVFVT